MYNQVRLVTVPTHQEREAFSASTRQCLECSTRKLDNFLATLSGVALDALLTKAKQISFSKHSFITAEETCSQAFFIILSGKVRLYIGDAEGREIVLGMLESGAHFGEIAILSNEPASINAIALKDTVCAVVCRQDFMEWLHHYPEAVLSLLSGVSRQIQEITERIKQMRLMHAYERITRALEHLAVTVDGVCIVHNRPTQQELADMVGASRETVNKILSDLHKGGYVNFDRKTLFITKKLPATWPALAS